LKFSYNWIGELVDGLEYPPGRLERVITMKTAECEGVEAVGALLADACAAVVQSVEPIPNSHNVKAVVNTGRYGVKTVVCGAPNCRPGMVTAYAPIGKKTINGVESDGMLASGAELEINKDHSGIVELQAEAGGPIAGCAADFVIDIDNKSLTHRPDLWGHHGMAREVAAILGHQLKDPARLELLPKGPAAIKVRSSTCARGIARWCSRM
jgi:phenylalanyl-tRNA synthetase beta chain